MHNLLAEKIEERKGEDFKSKKYRSDIFTDVKKQLECLANEAQMEQSMNNLVEAIT